MKTVHLETPHSELGNLTLQVLDIRNIHHWQGLTWRIPTSGWSREERRKQSDGMRGVPHKTIFDIFWNPSSVCLFQTKMAYILELPKVPQKKPVFQDKTHWSSLNLWIRPGRKNPQRERTKKKTNQRPTNLKSPPSMPKSPRTSSFTCQCGWL